VQTLWSTGNTTNDSMTIAQLLAQVNEIFPLEAEDWGLEDYAVQVGPFECLHFSVLQDILKDNEEVMYVTFADSH
jgi:hypothetical protein